MTNIEKSVGVPCTDRVHIEALLQKHKKVWFFVPEEIKKEFVAKMNALGAIFTNGETLTEENCGRYMSLTCEKKLSYVSAMAWSLAGEPGDGSSGIYHSFERIPKVTYTGEMQAES